MKKIIDKDKKLFGYLLLTPAFFIIIGVYIFPLVYSLIMSFYDWRLAMEARTFIGFENYLCVFKDLAFKQAFNRNMIFALVTLTLEIIIGFGVALLLNSGIRGQKLGRMLFSIPYFATPTVVGFNARWMFASQLGIINKLLTCIGLSAISWLSSSTSAFIAIIIVNIWQYTPFVTLLLLAGLQSIPEEIEDAAAIDGSTYLQKVYYIIMPLLRPYFTIISIMLIIWVFRIFDVPFTMTGGGPAGATTLLSMEVHRTAFNSLRFGYASAQSYIIVLLTAFITTFLLIGELRRLKSE